MTDYTCPAEGCDYSAETFNSVNSHLTAKSGPEHAEKSELRQALRDQQGSKEPENDGQQQDEEPAEPAESEPAEQETDDSPEDTEPASEPAEESQESMPTPEEYEQQKASNATETDEDADEGDSDDLPAPTESSGGLPVPSMPTDTGTLIALGAVVVMGLLIYMWVRSGDSADPEPVASEPVEETDDDGETTLIE